MYVVVSYNVLNSHVLDFGAVENVYVLITFIFLKNFHVFRFLAMASDTKPRGPIAAMYNSPGPASYQLRPTIGAVEHSKSSTHRQMPSYSIAGRPKGGDTDKSPGPCYNLPPGYNHKGASGIPSYSLAPRAKDLSMDSIPGPDKYDDSPCTDKVKRKAPAYSFGLKTDAHSKNNNPGKGLLSVSLLIHFFIIIPFDIGQFYFILSHKSDFCL